MVGLTIGTFLAYRPPDQDWRLYEIDPLIGEIASDRDYFHYMA